MSTRMRRATQAQADREVMRKASLFYEGLREDTPSRESGDNSDNGITCYTRGINVIPTQKTLRCRPKPFDIGYGQFPPDIDQFQDRNIVAIDLNGYGQGIAIDDYGGLWIHNPLNTPPYDTWLETGASPWFGNTTTALDLSINRINKYWYIDYNNGTVKNRYQIEIPGAFQVSITPIGIDDADYDLYMRQLPLFDSTDNFDPSQSAPYIYDFLFTFVFRDTDGNILRETGTWNLEGYEWNPSGQTAEYYRVYLEHPISATYDSWFDFTQVRTNPSSPLYDSNLQTPVGYNGIAVYRTANKSNLTPDTEVNSLADEMGGLLNLDFRLVGVFTSFNSHASVNMTDAELYGRRVVPTFQYIPIGYTNLSIITNGMYMAWDNDKLSYTDIGANFESLGWCYPGIQQIQMEAPITALAEMQNSIVAFSNSTTWRFPMDQLVYLKSSVPGRVVSQLQSWFTFATTGVSPNHRLSAINWTNNAIIAFCSDHTIRIFDGNKWGDDLTWLKVNRRLSKAHYSFSYFDPKGYFIICYLNNGETRWQTLRMSLRQDVNGAFSEFDGADWPVDRLIKAPFVAAGDLFLSKENQETGGSAILLWDSENKKIVGYGEMDDYFELPTTSECVIRVGTFTGENMSYWTTHQESHIYLDANYISDLTPGGIKAKIIGLYAGVNGSAQTDEQEIIGRFQDGQDVIFQKWIGAYRGYDIEFILPHGGYEVIEIDTRFRVIDRPVWNRLNEDVDLPIGWNKGLLSRILTRYSTTTDLCNREVQLANAGSYTRQLDPLSEDTEIPWAIRSSMPVSVSLPDLELPNQMLWSIWFKRQADTDSEMNTAMVFGQTIEFGYNPSTFSAVISVNGTQIFSTLDISPLDGTWHLVWVLMDFDSEYAIGGMDNVVDTGVSTVWETLNDEIQVKPTPTMWDMCVLDGSLMSDVPTTMNHYYRNIRNYCKP